MTLDKQNIIDPRAAHSSDEHENKLYIYGGWDGMRALNELFCYDPNENSWREIKFKQQPPERNNHASAIANSKLYIHGGHDGVSW